MNKKLLFGLIGAIVATGAFGEATTQTIPTQAYVDDNFQTKIPAGTVRTGSVVSHTNEDGTVGERGIYNNALPYGLYLRNSQTPLVASLKDYLTTMDDVTDVVKHISSSAGVVGMASATSVGQNQKIAVFSGQDEIGFRQMLAINSVSDVNGDSSIYIPTMKAMEEKQNKMTCTRWLDTPENPDHTDENCLLWELSN